MTPEKIVQNKLMSYLKQLEDDGAPIFHERRQAGGFSYKKGIPDLYVVVNGRHLEVEVKKPGGHLSPMQEKFRDICLMKNIPWTCVDNLDDFKLTITKLLSF